MMFHSFNIWKKRDIPQKQLTKNPILKGKVLESFLEILPNEKTLLDIGCSTGLYCDVVEEIGYKYSGCDYSEHFIKRAKELHPNSFKLSDATKLDYLDNEFDVVLHSACLFYIKDYEKSISEAARVASKYVIFARLEVTQEKIHTIKTYAYGHRVLQIIFNEQELIKLFNKYGLEVIKTSYNEPTERGIIRNYLCNLV